jgi:predicted hydrolase (HD superfamily)
VLCAFVVSGFQGDFNTETRRSQKLHREDHRNQDTAITKHLSRDTVVFTCLPYFNRASFSTLIPKQRSFSAMPDRNDAWELLCEYTKGDSLRKHALAVETAMRACAKRYGEPEADEDEWGIVGLLHDFDYEMFPTPDQHPFTGANIMCGRGYSDRIIRAILGHATYTGVPRDTAMARALFATDELCGFLVACALVRPSKSLDDLEVSSVKKKLKDKAFARSVNRDDIRQGVEEWGIELDDHVRFVIDALRPVQKEIGLNSSEKT